MLQHMLSYIHVTAYITQRACLLHRTKCLVAQLVIIMDELGQPILLWSADNHCKQFKSRSGPNVGPDLDPNHLKKVNFEKNQQMKTKS